MQTDKETKEKRKRVIKGPDDPASVGWTIPQYFFLKDDFPLECGGFLKNVVLEYETYGTLNEAHSNAILICHAYTGDAHVAGWDKTASEKFRPWRLKEPGWWDCVIGPGEPFDTNRFFVICVNVLGSCYGSTGPASPNPDDANRPYAGNFPMVTTNDWLRSQVALLEHLGIKKLYAVAGGSMGGFIPLEMAMGYPDMVERCVVLASDVKQCAQTLAINYIFRSVIENDPSFKNGSIYGDTREANELLDAFLKEQGIDTDLHYYAIADRQQRGLYAARMLAVITYLSHEHLENKFGHNYQPARGSVVEKRVAQPGDKELSVQAFFNHLCEKFLERFDANSFLIISKTLDHFDVQEKWGHGDLHAAVARIKAKTMVVSFTSDWLFPQELIQKFIDAFKDNGQPITSMNIQTLYGHDAFLEEADAFKDDLQKFLSE